MSKCGSTSQEGMAEPSGRVYQFLDLSNDNPEARKQNLTKARSYIMKNIRRRRQMEDAKKDRFVGWTPTAVKRKQSQALLTSMNLSLLDSASSPWPCTDVMPTLETQRKWSPLARQLMQRQLTEIFPTIFPPAKVVELWESVIRPSSMVIHSSMWSTYVSLIERPQAVEKCITREMLSHRGAGLRLINEELSLVRNGKAPSDALLLSILATTIEFRDMLGPADMNEPAAHPFRISHMPKGWDFLTLRYSQAHINGLFELVARLGGLGSVQNRPIAKSIAIFDMMVAAMELRAPVQPWIEIDEIASLVADLSLNVPEPEPHLETRVPGSSLSALRELVGALSPLAPVLDKLQRVVAASCALTQGRLSNVNLMALSGESTALHHAILSVPPCQDCATSGLLYEPVRLVTLIIDVGVLFPQPPALGLLGRLVRRVKAELECLAALAYTDDDMAEALVWILFITGVAATGMPEKDWFVERLSRLTQSMKQWSEVKQLLMSFVWVPDSIDEAAMDLWIEVRCYGNPF